MKNLINFLFMVFLIIHGERSHATDIRINFSGASITDARKKAGDEGKLIFVDFYANWCTPCKWMEQTTFKDESVIKALNADFVSVKIDIDDVSGYELKNTYDVKYLPTMLIFNSQGQLVDRIEETLSPRLLKNLLEKHNAPQNKVIIKHDFNVSPSQKLKGVDIKESDSNLLTKEEYNKYYQQRQVQDAFRVQVGVFENYERASELVNKLRENFLEPISVVNEFRNNKMLFKVRIGQYNRVEDAENLKNVLKSEFNMQGIVQ